MEKKVMNTRLAVAAVVLLFGLLLAGQQAAAADEAATATTTTTEAAEAPPTTPSYGKSSKADCEVPGTCDVKLAADADPKRPGADANAYTRGCSKLTGCRD